MRSFLSALVLVGALTTLPACTPTWFQDFQSDPVKQTDRVLDTAQTALDVANVTWAQLRGFLAPEQQEALQPKFDQAVVTANLAMQAVRDAVRAAATAQDENPNFLKLLADVGQAVDSIRAVITSAQELASAAKPGAAPGAVQTPVEVPSMAALNALSASVQDQTK